jgi:hypothetical protein
MRRPLLVAIAVVGLAHCEQRFSSTPPTLAPASSAGAIDALLAPNTADAGATSAAASHAMTITLCSASAQPCPPTDTGGSEVSYRVVFGSGRAEIRTRGQAMADLYKELRDRTAAGERLDAEPRAAGDAGPAVGAGGAASSEGSGDDPISKCAFHLLDIVDGIGEVSLDVVHQFGSGKSGCRISLRRDVQCLVRDPERPKGPGTGGMSF